MLKLIRRRKLLLLFLISTLVLSNTAYASQQVETAEQTTEEQTILDSSSDNVTENETGENDAQKMEQIEDSKLSQESENMEQIENNALSEKQKEITPEEVLQRFKEEELQGFDLSEITVTFTGTEMIENETWFRIFVDSYGYKDAYLMTADLSRIYRQDQSIIFPDESMVLPEGEEGTLEFIQNSYSRHKDSVAKVWDMSEEQYYVFSNKMGDIISKVDKKGTTFSDDQIKIVNNEFCYVAEYFDQEYFDVVYSSWYALSLDEKRLYVRTSDSDRFVPIDFNFYLMMFPV